MSDRTGYIAGLRQLADWLDAHPEIRLPHTGTWEHSPFQLGVWLSKDELVTITKALPGPLRKEHSETVLRVHGQFSDLHVEAYAGRSEVCKRVVTGTETVTETVKDPEALALVPEVEVTREVEKVEWRCAPILADATGEQVSA